MKTNPKNRRTKWEASQKYKGLRMFTDKTKKNGSRWDVLFGIRYQIGDKRYEYILGYASQGWTEAKASLEIEKYKDASLRGTGAASKTEQKKIRRSERLKKEQEEAEEKKKKTTFSEFFEEYYILSQSHKAPKSIESERYLYKKWLKPIIGHIPFIELKARNIEEIKIQMERNNRTPSSIKYTLSIISQMWTLARRDELVYKDCPTRQIKLAKTDNNRCRYLTEKEAKLLLNELREHSEQLYEIALISLSTGMRFGEIVNLEWNCIDFDSGLIVIKDPKARKNRVAYMLDNIHALFSKKRLESIDCGKGAEGLIFTNTAGGRITSISHTFDRVANRLFNQNIQDKRDKVVFHTLRHTYATWLVQRKIDIFSVKELLGHASIKMTLRYSHHSPEGLRKSAFTLNDLQF